MPTLPRPVDFLRWTTGSPGNRVDIPATQRENGWAANQRPPFEFMNQLFFEIDDWIKFFDSVATQFTQTPTVIVNADPALGNFTSIQAAHDDPNTIAGTTILVTSNIESAVNTQISKQDIGLTFAPGTSLIKAAGAPDGLRGLEIVSSADRVRIQHARVEGFSGAGDISLWVDVGADHVFLFNPIFGSGQTQNIETNANSTVVQIGTQEL